MPIGARLLLFPLVSPQAIYIQKPLDMHKRVKKLRKTLGATRLGENSFLLPSLPYMAKG